MINCRILTSEDKVKALKLLDSDTFRPFKEKFGRNAENLFLSYIKNWLEVYYPEGDSLKARTDYKLPTEEQLLAHLIRTTKLEFLRNIVDPNKISYYNIWYQSNEHAELSNFADRPFTYTASTGDEYEVKSVEQAFQLEKLLSVAAWDEEDKWDEVNSYRDQLLNTKNSYEVQKLGRKIPMTTLDIESWDIKKENIMREIIKQSLIQNPKVLKTLLSINKPITHFNENNKSPKFWGTRFPKILEELREELKGSDYVDVTNFMDVRSDKVVIKPFKKPWRSDPSKVNDTMRIYLKDNPDKGYFEVVKDEEDNYYSVHFKPEDKTNPKAFSDEEKEILFQAVADIIPYGAYLSTWGELTKGGIAGLNRFGGLGFTEVDKREVKTKDGDNSGITIPIWQKTINSNDTIIRESEEFYNRADAMDNPDLLYIFTDNTDRTSGGNEIEDGWYAQKYGKGGYGTTQNPTSAIVRGLPNAAPISTMKWFYRNHEGISFDEARWHDEEFDEFKKVIDAEIEDIKKLWKEGNFKGIVLPKGGLTSRLEVGKRDRRFAAFNINRVPKLYAYLNKKMAELSEYVNDSSTAENFESNIGTINEENWHKVDAIFTSTKKRKRTTLINKLFSKEVKKAQERLIAELEEQLAKATSTRTKLDLAKAIKNMTPFVAIKQEQPINLYDKVKQIFKDYIECAEDPEGFKELVEAELEASVGTFLDKFPEAVKRKMTENKIKYSAKEYQLMLDNWDELIQDAAGIYGDTYSIYIDLTKNMIHEEFTEDSTDDEGYNREEAQEDTIEETPYKDGWMQDVRELSVAESMTNKVRNSINDIERVDRNGNIVVDDLGYAQTLQASYVFTEILQALKNMTTSSEMIPMLEKLQSRKPWASQIVNAIKNDDKLFTAYYRVFRKDFMNMWVQRVITLPDGTIQIKTVNINKPSGTAHYFDEWRDNFEYGVVLDKEDSIYNENGEIRVEKAKVGLELVNSILEKFREARASDKDKEKENIQKVILENTATINKLLNMIGVAITPESLKELLEYNINYDDAKLLPGQIVLNQLSIIFKNIPKNDAIKDGEPVDLLNLYGSAFNKIATAINNIDEDEVESSTRQGKKTLYAHTRPSYLTTLIKKLRSSKAESFIDSEYKPVNFLHDQKFGWYNTLIADLREDPNAREKLEHMVLLEFNRKEYSQWTPLDTFLALFSQYNAEPMDAKSKEGYAWYQSPLLSDTESAEFIRAKRIKTNYEEVLLKKFVNVIRQEYNRIITVKQRYNNKSIEKIAGYDMADNSIGGAKFYFFPELNTEAFSEKDKSFFERLAEVADDTEAFEKLAKDAILKIMDMNFANAVANWASIGVFDRVDPNNGTSAFKYFKQRSRERIENILREYYWNSTYMQSQIIQLLTTDLAQYGSYENFTKRALEFHSPTEKLNTLAKWNGEYVLADKKGNVRPARAIALEDEIKPSKWTPEIEEILDAKISDGKLTKYDKSVILSLWNKINTTDAQAMRTFKSFRATQIAGDMWDDESEEAYNNIRGGNWTAKDFVVLWNTRKPYLYTQKNQPDGVGGTMRKALQHKNSEIIMLTQAVFGAILHQSSKFRALSEFMEENDIDVAMFGSAIKVGGQGFINLNDETSIAEIKEKLAARYLKNGEINTDAVEEYNWEDYGFQVATPEHNINAIQLFGTQIRRLISADLGPNTVFTIGNKKFTLEQWMNYYNLINTANIREAFEKLDPIFKDPKKISELIIEEIKKNSRYSNDLIEAVTYKDGKFNIPIYDLTTSQRLQELLNSIVKSRIVKQKVKGGALIQATPWLLDEKDKPQIVWDTDKNGKKYIKYMEAYISCPDDSLYDLLIEPDGSINIDKKDSKGRYIVPEKYRRAIGYRIPTEYKYSMIPIRVKGFLPRQVGSVIILPEEITCTTGSDFDKLSMLK